jgi:hypothetical protein
MPFCDGGCGLAYANIHAQGLVFLGVLHWTERRFTRRGAKNFLTTIARHKRLNDPEYLNIPHFDWLYLHDDAVTAQGWANHLFGFRIPAHLFDRDRDRCVRLAHRRKVKLSNYPAVYSWAWMNR